ncbi:MAG: tRNA (adenosine(37)-N6)-dimethylallyltransferase MiaA [Bacteroidales bacterium]|nr:tRNA (adenosine(37)-N6)-dimethylallyltransferase MiaA [Bacteroidales bacterium]
MVSPWPVSSSPNRRKWNTSVHSSKIPSAVSSAKTLIVITGPTAVGKTQLCLDIARHFDIPIINADSRQIFKELSIGTAKPSAEELQQVRHYFVGTLSLQDYYSASLFESQVMALLGTLFQQSDYALMAGGSMMYIDAVCDGIDDIPTIDNETRATMKRRLAEEGLPRLCEELQRLDPEYYEIVDRQNPKRVVHALEICTMTGRTYTSFRKRDKKERPFRIVKIGLNREREELYQRINARVDKMMQQGLLKEAESVYPLRHLNALNTVGYKELFEYFNGRWSLEEAVERIKGNTRRYARKQLTWYKKDPQIRWFHPDQKKEIIDYIITQSS